MSKRLLGTFLLRKSKATGTILPVMTDADFPARFVFGVRTYDISMTKAGKLIMTAIENK